MKRNFTRQQYAALLRDLGLSADAEKDLSPKDYGGKDIKKSTLAEIVELIKSNNRSSDSGITSTLLKYLNARLRISRSLSPEGILEIFSHSDIHSSMISVKLITHLEKGGEYKEYMENLEEHYARDKIFDTELYSASNINPFFLPVAKIYTRFHNSITDSYNVIRKMPPGYMDEEIHDKFYDHETNLKSLLDKDIYSEFEYFFQHHQPNEYSVNDFHSMYEKIKNKLLEGENFMLNFHLELESLKSNDSKIEAFSKKFQKGSSSFQNMFSGSLFKNDNELKEWCLGIIKPYIYFPSKTYK